MFFLLLFVYLIVKKFNIKILLFMVFMIFMILFIDLFIKNYLQINIYPLKYNFNNFNYVRYGILNF